MNVICLLWDMSLCNLRVRARAFEFARARAFARVRARVCAR